MDFLSTLWIYMWIYAKWYFIIPYMVLRVLTGLYLKNLGFNNWYLGMIPVVHLYTKYDPGNIKQTILLIIQGLLGLFATAGCSILSLILLVPINIITDKCFCENVAFIEDTKYYKIPYYKFYYMVKEIGVCELLSKTMSMKKTKNTIQK